MLCTEERGSFARGRIVCPYHAWTYDLAGKLVATPRRMDTPDFRLGDFPLYEVAVDAWGGFVFVNLGRDAGPLAAAVGDRAQRYERYALNELKVGKRIVLDVQANWKLLAENFSECFHCPPVHPEFCRVVTAYQEAGAWGLRGAPEPRPEYRAGAQTLTLDGTARLPPFSRLTDEEKAKLYTADMVLPNLFLNLHPDYVNSQLMFPTGPQSVRMVYEWLFEPRHLPLSEADLQHYVALWDITNRQDARNCEWQQEGLQSREFRHGVYVPQEFDAHRFAQWVRDEIGSGHPSSPARVSARRAASGVHRGRLCVPSGGRPQAHRHGEVRNGPGRVPAGRRAGAGRRHRRRGRRGGRLCRRAAVRPRDRPFIPCQRVRSRRRGARRGGRRRCRGEEPAPDRQELHDVSADNTRVLVCPIFAPTRPEAGGGHGARSPT